MVPELIPVKVATDDDNDDGPPNPLKRFNGYELLGDPWPNGFDKFEVLADVFAFLQIGGGLE